MADYGLPAMHGEGIKPEDVRTLLITAYIQQTKNGGPNHA